jgi:LPS export ABC transporter protein LptC
MNRRALLLTLFALLLAVASTWLSRESDDEERQAAAASSTPDYFIVSFTATELGPDGEPARRLDAEHLSHYADKETVVHAPHLTVYRQEQAPWEMTARLGRTRDQGEVVLLSGGVRAYREGPEAMEIVTETLQVQPKRRYAETADPVTVTDARGHLEAVGMQADLNTEQVILQSRVRGFYAAP